MKSVKIIHNPVAGRGYSKKVEAEVCQMLKDEKVDFDIVQTEHVGHGIELTEQAVTEGFETIVAMGGDGTTNEVVNGLCRGANSETAGALGLIPTGTGSDFASNVGIPADLREACQRIAQGHIRKVDVGRIELDDQPPRYFDNMLGIGFDGVVTVEAKKFKRLRGAALYLPVVLKTIFVSLEFPTVTIEYDDQKMTLPIMQLSVANGAREGGAFYMTPEALLDDGLFDLCIAQKMSRLSMLGILPHFMKGTHTHRALVKMGRTKKVHISSTDNLIAHIDGELICTEGHKIFCEIFPQCLKVVC